MTRRINLPRDSRSDSSSTIDELIFDRSLEEVGSPLPLMGELVHPPPGVSLLDISLNLHNKELMTNKDVGFASSTNTSPTTTASSISEVTPITLDSHYRSFPPYYLQHPHPEEEPPRQASSPINSHRLHTLKYSTVMNKHVFVSEVKKDANNTADSIGIQKPTTCSNVDIDEHVIVHRHSFISMINDYLQVCTECSTGKLKLTLKKRNNLAATFRISCETCCRKEQAMAKQIHRSSIKQCSTTGRSATAKCERKTKAQQLRRLKQKHSTMKNDFQNMLIHPIKRHKQSSETQTKVVPIQIPFQDASLNYRAALAAIHLGAGALDIVKCLSMIGIGGVNHNFERAYHRVLPQINNKIIDVCGDIIYAAMKKEIIATIRQKKKVELSNSDIKKLVQLINDDKFEEVNKQIGNVPLTISYDMGWNKRSGGRVFDSPSGHGYFIGCLTGNVIKMGVLSKICSVCKQNRTNNKPVPPHSCRKSYDGSSGSMEQYLAVQLCEEIKQDFKGTVGIDTIVSDDDSKLRSNCQKKKNGGRLEDDTMEPTFLCDPGHRVKTMTKKYSKWSQKQRWHTGLNDRCFTIKEVLFMLH